MAMRHISKVLADLMCDIEAKRAEAAQSPVQIHSLALLRQQAGLLEDSVGFPLIGGTEEASGEMEKVAGARHASPAEFREVVILPTGGTKAGRSITTARSSAAMSKRFPASAVVIDLLVWKCAHATGSG